MDASGTGVLNSDYACSVMKESHTQVRKRGNKWQTEAFRVVWPRLLPSLNITAVHDGFCMLFAFQTHIQPDASSLFHFLEQAYEAPFLGDGSRRFEAVQWPKPHCLTFSAWKIPSLAKGSDFVRLYGRSILRGNFPNKSSMNKGIPERSFTRLFKSISII